LVFEAHDTLLTL